MSATTVPKSPPPTWQPRGHEGLRLHPARVGLVLSLTLLLVLTFVLKVPRWAVAIMALVFPVGLLAWSVWSTRAWRSFEREINGALMSGVEDAPLRVYRRARWLRWFGPRHRMLTKFAQVLSIRGRHVAARRALEEAWVLSPARERGGLMAPLARELYEVEAWDDLRSVAEQWRARTPFKAAPNVYVAVSLVMLGDEHDRVASLLAEADGALTPDLQAVAARARAGRT